MPVAGRPLNATKYLIKLRGTSEMSEIKFRHATRAVEQKARGFYGRPQTEKLQY
jgi:hypothetical protein